jgi:hypothetical protein
MRKRAAVMVVLALTWCVLPTLVHAAGGGKPATKLVAVADTRDATGLAKWVGDVYNANLWLYGLMVVVVMAGMGLVLGLVFDRFLVLMGLELGKLDHHE